MELANYILMILKSQLMVIFSWGFNSPRAIKNGLAFRVQGYLFTGRVEVVYNEGLDLFEVRLMNPDGSVKQKETEVYADCLVDVIDGMVERCPDYEQRVAEDYGYYPG